MILRKQLKRRFTQVDLALLNNASLTWKAKCILIYLLSKPDNWKVRIQDIENRGKEGKHAVKSALKELRQERYLAVKTVRDPATGFFGGRELIVSDEPMINGKTENRTFRKTDFPEKQPLSNIEGVVRRNFSKKDTARGAEASGILFDDLEDESPRVNNHHEDVVNLFASHSRRNGHCKHQDPRTGKWVFRRGTENGYWSRQTLTRWDQHYQELIKEIDPERVEKVVRWFIKNGDHWCPPAETFPVFCERFQRIEAAMKRAKVRREYGSGSEDDDEDFRGDPGGIREITDRHGRVVRRVLIKNGKERELPLEDNEG